ncbi:MAG: lipopolysaccharide kinase InaA family protein [Caldimonas sp.]
MNFTALNCPQCGGPLPRQAAWRMVECPNCRAIVTRSVEVVERAGFRAALARSRGAATAGARTLAAGGASYALVARLGQGTRSDVYLGERLGALPATVTVKIARSDAGAEALLAEGRHLAALQALDVAGAAYFGQRLPQPVFAGNGIEAGADRRTVLVLRHPAGHWGSLAAVAQAQPNGVDARHIVWMWRRVLEVLAFTHRAGWSHGDLSLGHLLVHPAEHGVRIIGWARARHDGGSALRQACGHDLRQLAWSMRALLHGESGGAPPIPASTPAPLAALLRQVSEDGPWRVGHGAEDVEKALGRAASDAFGAPRFVAFDPLH